MIKRVCHFVPLKVDHCYFFKGICKMPLIEHSHRVERLYSPTTTNVKVKDNWVIMGTRISIVCDQDYTLNLDSALFTCRQNGWDFGTSPICKRMYQVVLTALHTTFFQDFSKVQ